MALEAGVYIYRMIKIVIVPNIVEWISSRFEGILTSKSLEKRCEKIKEMIKIIVKKEAKNTFNVAIPIKHRIDIIM